MAISIVMMSPKGGSGKTTLAISIAGLLSDCRINTLLLDCDFSTKGSTMFLKKKVQETGNFYLTMFEVFKNGKASGEIVKIKNFFNFIPAREIGITAQKSVPSSSVNKINAEEIIQNYEKTYDVIIYDLQAGETETLEWLEKRMRHRSEKDYILCVMEKDALTGSAFREMLNNYPYRMNQNENVNWYEIYNRVSEIEFNELIQTGGSGLLENPCNIKIDKSARQCARVNIFPTMSNTEPTYTEQVYQLCYYLMDTQKKEWLNIIKKEIDRKKRSSKITELTEQDGDYSRKIDKYKSKEYLTYFLIIPSLFALTYLLGITIVAPDVMNVQLMMILTIFSVAFLTGGVFLLLSGKLERQKANRVLIEIRKERSKLENESSKDNNL